MNQVPDANRDLQRQVSRIGTLIRTIAPKVARSAVGLPGGFTRTSQAFFKRLFSEETGNALVGLVLLSGVAIFAAFLIVEVFDNPPSNEEIFGFFIDTYNNITEKTKPEEYELFALIVALIGALIFLPIIARWAFEIVFALLFYVACWVVYLFLGKRVGILKENRTPDVQSSTNKPTKTDAKIEGGASSPSLGGGDAHLDSPISTKLGNIRSNKALVSIDLIHEQLSNRIGELLDELKKREDTNLGIGMIFSIVGVIGLAALVFISPHSWEGDAVEFLLWFIPRLAVALFIQLFAYFFLRLYRANLAEIKHFHKELNSIELRKMAIEIALTKGQE